MVNDAPRTEGVTTPPDTKHDTECLPARACFCMGHRRDLQAVAPTISEVECCASGSCEVCSGGSGWIKW